MILSAAVGITTEASITQGITISLVGMGVVFSGLVFLYFVMLFLDSFINKVPARQKPAQPAAQANTASGPEPQTGEPDEVVAAMIGLSLYMYNRKYEEAKDFILTGRKREIPYKPWTLAGRFTEVNRDSLRITSMRSR